MSWCTFMCSLSHGTASLLGNPARCLQGRKKCTSMCIDLQYVQSTDKASVADSSLDEAPQEGKPGGLKDKEGNSKLDSSAKISKKTGRV
mmetsp:Transcript_534/g.903  ORF Transcript_534/g.903 Transcript_534/m.903 type:complete len:89 (-) Transcript_534:87-353(-)